MKLVNENEKIIETIKCDGEHATKLILTDMNLYIVQKMFGEKRCVYLSTAKIDRLFFELNRNAIYVEVENTIYPIVCEFKEAELRLICKKFKEIKKNRPLKVKESLFLSNIVEVLLDNNKKEDMATLSTATIEDREEEPGVPETMNTNPAESTISADNEPPKQEDNEVDLKSEVTTDNKATGTLHIKPTTVIETESLFSDLEDKPKKGLFSLRKKK